MTYKMGFTPISIEDYVVRHTQSNRDDHPEEIRKSLQRALQDYRAGVTCHCGARLWVVGSAVAGNACFTCITGEAHPDSDFEIDEVMK
jgi:hypothetical protein